MFASPSLLQYDSFEEIEVSDSEEEKPKAITTSKKKKKSGVRKKVKVRLQFLWQTVAGQVVVKLS